MNMQTGQIRAASITPIVTLPTFPVAPVRVRHSLFPTYKQKLIVAEQGRLVYIFKISLVTNTVHFSWIDGKSSAHCGTALNEGHNPRLLFRTLPVLLVHIPTFPFLSHAFTGSLRSCIISIPRDFQISAFLGLGQCSLTLKKGTFWKVSGQEASRSVSARGIPSCQQYI